MLLPTWQCGAEQLFPVFVVMPIHGHLSNTVIVFGRGKPEKVGFLTFAKNHHIDDDHGTHSIQLAATFWNSFMAKNVENKRKYSVFSSLLTDDFKCFWIHLRTPFISKELSASLPNFEYLILQIEGSGRCKNQFVVHLLGQDYRGFCLARWFGGLGWRRTGELESWAIWLDWSVFKEMEECYWGLVYYLYPQSKHWITPTPFRFWLSIFYIYIGLHMYLK